MMSQKVGNAPRALRHRLVAMGLCAMLVWAGSVTPVAAQTHGTFSHKPEEVQLGEAIADGDCVGRRKLLHPLAFFENDERAWEAPAWTSDAPGCVGTTDGASIPPAAQWVIGDPFDPDLLRPAIIHDHYVYPERQGVRPWITVTRAFYAGLRASGVSYVRANAMYFAVYTFGPYWGVKTVKPGIPCTIATGGNCVLSAPIYADISEPGTLMSQETAEAIEAFAQTDVAGTNLTVEEIERIAAELFPDEVNARKGLMASRPADPTMATE